MRCEKGKIIFSMRFRVLFRKNILSSLKFVSDFKNIYEIK